MVAHMKTTIDIPDALFKAAKRQAAREGTTLRAVIERALRQALGARGEASRFRLRDASVGGRGLQPGVAAGGWDRIRELAYEDRGG
jgi:Arc/MetJ family transcription regulator